MTGGNYDNIHESLTLETVQSAAEDQMYGLGNAGFCLACGAERDGCEPDAENYECYECGENRVMGASELFMVIA